MIAVLKILRFSNGVITTVNGNHPVHEKITWLFITHFKHTDNGLKQYSPFRTWLFYQCKFISKQVTAINTIYNNELN